MAKRAVRGKAPAASGAEEMKRRYRTQPTSAPRPAGVKLTNSDVDDEANLYSKADQGGARTFTNEARQAANRRMLADVTQLGEEQEGDRTPRQELRDAASRRQGRAWRRLNEAAAEGSEITFPDDVPPTVDDAGDEGEEPAGLGPVEDSGSDDSQLDASPVQHAQRRETPPAPQVSPVNEQAIGVLTLDHPTEEDIDNLWDWLRVDDEPQSFLGIPIRSSPFLHKVMTAVYEGEQTNQSLLRSIVWVIGGQRTHLGFVAVAPIQDQTGVLHIYLSLELRGSLPGVARTLLPDVMALLPHHRLAVYSTDERWTRLHRSVLAPLGFVEHVMFVR